MALRDLLIKLKVEANGKELEVVEASLERTKKSAEGLGRILGRIGSYYIAARLIRAGKNFIESQIEQADALDHNAERLGISTDELQKYNYVSGLIGVSAEKVAIGFRYFNRAVGEAALGNKSANKTFAQLGIQIKGTDGKIRPTSDLLADFSDALKKIPDQAARTALEMRLLGRTGSALLPLFQKGSVAIREMFKDVDELGGGFQKDFIEAAHKTDVQLKRLAFGWRSVSVAIVTEILPVFNHWIERSIHTVKLLIDLAKKTYGFRTALIALATGAAFFALKRLFNLFQFGKLTVADFFTALLRNTALVAFVALLTAAYLILDDFYTFMQGGDSIIGRFLDAFGGAGTALKFWQDLKKAFADIGEALKPARNDLAEITKLIGQAFIESVPSIVQFAGVTLTRVAYAVDYLITRFRQLYNILGGGSKRDVLNIDESLDKRLRLYDKIADSFANIPTVPVGQAPIGPGDPRFVGPPQAARSGPVQVENNITVHMGANADPTQVGQAVKKGATEGTKSGLSEYRDTYDAINIGQPF